MEPSKGSGPIGVPLTRGCEETAMGLHLEATPSSESCDVDLPEPQPPRTLKWTTLKIFGGRRNICTLPNFFRRRKSHGKGPSKKGMSKSKTHDGISKVSWEDGRRAGDMPARDFEYHSQKDSALASCQSSQVMNEFSEGGVSCLLTPSGNHKPFWDKSLQFCRPKRGLKGFFSSLRRHKKNRNVELENHEAFELSGDVCDRVVLAAESSIDNQNYKSLGSLAEPKVPVSSVKDSITCEVTKEAIVSENVIASTDQDRFKLQTGADGAVELAADVLNVDSEGEAPCEIAELTYTIAANADYTERGQLSVQSPYQISVILGDDASLKSFDSLTGCGDVIADQDDDSIANSTVSGEKSRSAGKRSSCYVNYQGGGEEMATPDEVDRVDYLRGLWESNTGEDVGSFPREHPGFVMCDVSLAVTTKVSPIPSPHMDTGNNSGSLQPTTHAPRNVLTPQSDQQGSLPNSDEGYYDSTTPGPEDDRGDDIIGIMKERLPRDSYSGDALYELYESEDPLTSPLPEEKPSVEMQPPILDSLDFVCLMSQSADEEHPPGFTHGTTFTGTEEVRFAKVQHELLGCGQQGAKNSTAKEQAEFGFCLKKSPNESIPGLNKKQCLEEQQVVSWTLSPKGECVFYESICLNDRNKNCQSVSCFQKTDNHLDYTNLEDVVCTATVPKSALPLQTLTSYSEQGYRRNLSENRGKKRQKKKVAAEAEHSQTVCFSQALVDFTKNGKLFNNLSQSPEPGSSFVENVEALPAMVTFDVFDTENEGECDRHTEMELEMEVADEDVESPYDTSPYESYLQKDAFAECDDRMLNDFDRSLFYSNTWGVASLPRYCGLASISLPVPAPLSAKRRSRSLDTDTLESEISDLCLIETKAKPLLSPHLKLEQCSSSSVSPLHLKKFGHLASPEMQSRDETTASWQPDPSGSSVPPLTDGERVGREPSALEWEGAMPACCQAERPQPQHVGLATKCKIRPQTLCAVQEKQGCNSTPLSLGQMVRLSHLPVKCGPRPSQPDPTLSGIPGDHICRDPAQVSGLDDKNKTHLSHKYFAKQLHDCHQLIPKIRPVGVTRGMPHFRPDTNRTSKLASCKKQRELSSKGREDLSASLPVGCHKHSV
ncbi:hypothetical protein AAFF_G00326320 [Aldrovandia affinis]|uniref:APC membrane recruitment protein 1 n=1 Tax=Aldrovandia affinis TaxID=143900 RepID=A0AAD7T992_9TELE|nr:hypothetical protein AAFF_G00326320 [Aldrovandia affinis]